MSKTHTTSCRCALQLGQTIIFVRTRATAHNLHRAVSSARATPQPRMLSMVVLHAVKRHSKALLMPSLCTDDSKVYQSYMDLT